MIAKLSTGNGFGGATRYLLRDGMSDEEKAKVKVLAAVGVDYAIAADGSISLDATQVSRDFRFQAMMHPSVRKPVYDFALSWKVGEHIPSEEKRARTEEFLERIGFNNTQYVIIEHEKENEHSHAIANIVDNEGNRISTDALIDRMHAVAREMTLRYGYAWGNPANKETIDHAHKPHEKARYTIEPIVKEAVAKANHIDDLPGLLKPSGIGCTIKRSSEGAAVGISFSYEMDGQLHTFRGSDLDRSLSARNIVRDIAARKAQEEASRIAAQQELARQKAEAEARLAAEKAAQEAARKAQEEAARAVEERRRIVERLAGQPETFVIHSDMDATLYSNRPNSAEASMLHEAARSILKFYTWGASVRYNRPEEFIEDAVNGRQFGTVEFNVEKARFIGENRDGGMLQNPDEVVRFIDQDGQAQDLFTPDFWRYWNQQLGALKHYLDEKVARQEAKDIIAGYNSVVLPMGDNLQALRSSAYHLYKEAKVAGLSLSVATSAKYRELSNAWKEFDEQRHKAANIKVAKEMAQFLGGALICLNPIIGLTAAFVAAIVFDIKQSSIRSQQQSLLAKVDAVRGDLAALKEKKSALNIVKQDLLQQYLDAKRMYQEYHNSLKTVDREVAVIKSDLLAAAKEDYIRQYVSSEYAKNLLAYINSQFVETHYSLVPGPLIKTEKGMRWILYTEGFRDPNNFNRILYHQQEPAPQDHGKSYIDFSYNEKGELVGSVECDPKDHYTSGLSGQVNIKTKESTVARRTFRGSMEEERIRKQKIKDNYAKFTAAEKKPKKNTGPKPGH